MNNRYTENQLREGLPDELWDDVADYLSEIEPRRFPVNLVGWGGGIRRIPHL